MGSYATAAEIKSYAAQAGKGDNERYEQFAEPASRIIDGLCNVPDDWFQPSTNAVSERAFKGSGTFRLRLEPYKCGSIQHVEYANLDDYTPEYVEEKDRNGTQWLRSSDGAVWRSCGQIVIVAAWGLPDVPADIRQACCELTLVMKYTRDPAQTKIISDANGNAITFAAIPKRTQEICNVWRKRQPLVFA